MKQLLMMRTRGLAGPMFQSLGGGRFIRSAGNYIGAPGNKIPWWDHGLGQVYMTSGGLPYLGATCDPYYVAPCFPCSAYLTSAGEPYVSSLGETLLANFQYEPYLMVDEGLYLTNDYQPYLSL